MNREKTAFVTGAVRNTDNFSTDPDILYRWRNEMADLIESAE